MSLTAPLRRTFENDTQTDPDRIVPDAPLASRVDVSEWKSSLRRAGRSLDQVGRDHLADTSAEVLNLLEAGTVVIKSSFEIVQANPAAFALMREGSFLSAANGRLIFSERRAAESVRDAFVVYGKSRDILGSTHIFKQADGTIFHLRVSCLAANEVDADADRLRRNAVVFVQKISFDNGNVIPLIGHTFQLTATESRVLFAIVQIGGVPKVARHLAVAETTIKTHLQRIFVKTNTRRQADLARLVTAISRCV